MKRAACDIGGRFLGYYGHSSRSCVQYQQGRQPLGAHKNCDLGGRSCGADLGVLQLVDIVTSIARVAGAMEVPPFGFRTRYGPCKKQAFLDHRKFVVALPYLVRNSPTEGIPLLGPYFFDSSQCGVLSFVIRRISVQYVSCTIYVVCDGMYRMVRIVVVVDRILR